MTGPQLEFIACIEACEPRSAPLPSGTWMADAMKVVHLVPERMTPPQAAAVFIRWLYDEPPHDGDGIMLQFLAGKQ
jgi:hypothetical protein